MPRPSPRKARPRFAGQMTSVIRHAFVIAAVAFTGPLAPGRAHAETRYVDITGAPVYGHERGIEILQSYYGDAVPTRFTIESTDKARSLFQPRGNRVLISNQSQHKEYNSCAVEHESAHLALFAYTRGASLREEFRFIDEGMATLIDAEACHRLEESKRKARRMAADAMRLNRVSFAAVQKWSVYFGIPERGTPNWDAYQIGVSFNLFLWERYGKERLLAFLKELGTQGELGAALQASVGKDAATIESEWLGYLGQPLPPSPPPKLARLQPDNQATAVSPDTKEIVMEFDQAMHPSYSLLTPCDEGVCFRDAYWKSDRILAIRVALRPDHEYRIKFGNEKTGQQKFISFEGIPMSYYTWTFKTAGR